MPAAVSTLPRARRPIEVRVLGALEAHGPGGSGLGAAAARHHVRVLLALLAASDEGIERDELLEALWPAQAPAASRNRLYHTLHLLRQALGALAWPAPWVQLAGGRVVLAPEVGSDARDLLAAVRGLERGELGDAALHELLARALPPWMPGVDAGALGVRMRERLRAAQAQLLAEALHRQQGSGDAPQRRELLATLLALRGTDEPAARALMALDLAAARPHAVLRTYEALARRLAEELGLRPGAETSALADAARRRIDGAAHIAAEAVPRPLIGREALLERLAAALARPGACVSLHGVGGVGKTALARSLAHRLAAAGRRLRVVDMRGGSVPGRAADAAVSALWLSHRPLAEPGCEAFQIEPLPLPPAGTGARQARRYAAFALYERCCAEPPGEADAPDIVALLQRLDGLPLAIEAAAARAATMTPRELLERVHADARVLDGAGVPSPLDALHASVAALPAGAREDFVALATGPAALPDDRVAGSSIAAWAAAGFVQRGAAGRWVPLHLACDVAREVARASGRWPALQAARLDELHARVAPLDLGFASPSLEAALGPLAALHDEALGLLDAAAGRGDGGVLVALLVALGELWLLTQRAALARRWLPAGLRAAVALGRPAEEAALHILMARALRQEWRFGEAAVEGELALAAARRALSAAAGPAARLHGDAPSLPAGARQPADAAGRLADAAGLLAELWLRCRRAEVAQALLRDVAVACAGHPRAWAVWRLHAGRAGVHSLPGGAAVEPLPLGGAALDALRQRLAGSRLWHAMLAEVARRAAAAGAAEAALAAADELVARGRRVGLAEVEAQGRWALAGALLRLDRVAEALSAAQALLAWWRGQGAEARAAEVVPWLAELLWRHGEPARAVLLLDTVARVAPARALEVEWALQRIAADALDGRAAAALPRWLALAEQADTLEPPQLLLAAEAGALVLRAADSGLAWQPLAARLRAADADHETLPLVRRFRERWLGAPDAAGGGTDALRRMLGELAASVRQRALAA